MNVFIIWLIFVIAWNFGYPEASPIEDVLVAVILALFNIFLRKYDRNFLEYIEITASYNRNISK